MLPHVHASFAVDAPTHARTHTFIYVSIFICLYVYIYILFWVCRKILYALSHLTPSCLHYDAMRHFVLMFSCRHTLDLLGRASIPSPRQENKRDCSALVLAAVKKKKKRKSFLPPNEQGTAINGGTSRRACPFASSVRF